MKRALLAAFPLVVAMALRAQTPAQEFTDPKALLDAVAKIYAAGGDADQFHLEEVEESVSKSELEDDRTAIQGAGNLYRIEERSPFGSLTQVSDGTTETIYLSGNKDVCGTPCAAELARISQNFCRGWGTAERMGYADIMLSHALGDETAQRMGHPARA